MSNDPIRWAPTRYVLIDERPNPRLDAVIADTVAKIKAVPTNGPFPARRKV